MDKAAEDSHVPGDRSIIFEEHLLPPFVPAAPNEAGRPYSLHDAEGERLEEMERCGVGRMVLSIRAPGVQGISDPGAATMSAIRTNDYMAELVGRYPDKYSGFAAVPLQDVEAAIAELTRCVDDLGLVGVMINGFTSDGEGGGLYYDHERYLPFWEAVEHLAVPVYLHPRTPLDSQRLLYEGYRELYDAPSTWAFAIETAAHVLRLILSGLFDRLPRLRIVLGHMGELLPFGLWRFDNRSELECPRRLEKTVSDYFRDNFYVTTSGVLDDDVLAYVVKKLGIERVLFSVDYPFEHIEPAAKWLETTPVLSDSERSRVRRLNAVDLFAPSSSRWE